MYLVWLSDVTVMWHSFSQSNGTFSTEKLFLSVNLGRRQRFKCKWVALWAWSSSSDHVLHLISYLMSGAGDNSCKRQLSLSLGRGKSGAWGHCQEGLVCLGHEGHGCGQLGIRGYINVGISMGGFQNRECIYEHEEWNFVWCKKIYL